MAATPDFVFVEPDGTTESAVRRKNPDGTIGGWVARSARVHPSAIIEPDAIVEPGANVGRNERVENGTVVIGRPI